MTASITIATDSDALAAGLAAVLHGAAVRRTRDDAGAILVVPTTSAWLGPQIVHEPLYVVDEAADAPASLARLAAVLDHTRRITPTRAEHGMHAAYGAALRSAAPRGGVGAALVDGCGDVVALGTAEVPAYGGGQYWDGDPGDARDVHGAGDPATLVRAATVELMLELLIARGATLPGAPAPVAAELLAAFDRHQGAHGVGHGGAPAQTFESLGRVVHAEMAALMNAARNGVRTGGLTMYVTAAPCRQCLRHLVCAGLERVVYLGARLAAPPAFHADSVAIGAEPGGRLALLPFTGVAPGAYARLFGRQMQRFLARECP